MKALNLWKTKEMKKEAQKPMKKLEKACEEGRSILQLSNL